MNLDLNWSQIISSAIGAAISGSFTAVAVYISLHSVKIFVKSSNGKKKKKDDVDDEKDKEI